MNNLKNTNIIIQIEKTKNLNKLLRLSESLISNDGSQYLDNLKEHISQFQNKKNFQNKYLQPILIHSCKVLDLKALQFFFKNFDIEGNFELIFSLIYYSIRKFSVFKYIYNNFDFNLNGKYAVILLIFSQNINKKVAKHILNYMNLNYSRNIEEILSFLLETKENECFKKYTKHEYAFSDFLLDYDYENKAISKYPIYKNRISEFDKNIYEERYKQYLMEKVSKF